MPRRIYFCALVLASLPARAEDSFWSESLSTRYGEFAVRIDGGDGSVSVLRGDERAVPSPELRIRLSAVGGADTVVELRKRERWDMPLLYQGKPERWSGALEAFTLERAEGKQWVPLGRFRRSSEDK